MWRLGVKRSGETMGAEITLRDIPLKSIINDHVGTPHCTWVRVRSLPNWAFSGWGFAGVA